MRGARIPRPLGCEIFDLKIEAGHLQRLLRSRPAQSAFMRDPRFQGNHPPRWRQLRQASEFTIYRE
jgi:hypothetical protein